MGVMMSFRTIFFTYLFPIVETDSKLFSKIWFVNI